MQLSLQGKSRSAFMFPLSPGCNWCLPLQERQSTHFWLGFDIPGQTAKNSSTHHHLEHVTLCLFTLTEYISLLNMSNILVLTFCCCLISFPVHTHIHTHFHTQGAPYHIITILNIVRKQSHALMYFWVWFLYLFNFIQGFSSCLPFYSI